MAPLLSVIIVVFNRRQALERTLAEVSAALERLAAFQGGVPVDRLDIAARRDCAEIIVVDNASTDGSTDGIEDRFPSCRVIRLTANTGVAAFNRGAEAAAGTYLLILDDDAWPDGDSLSQAVGFLESTPGVAAVMLQPVHPGTGRAEWPFDRVGSLTREWPDLRCANLIRRDAWNAVCGYEERFFLYRNDTDLALKLLGAGRDVVYQPAWRAMHDSPHIAVRRVRWFTLSTRNWIWMCRRHAPAPAWVLPALLGWFWAHRLARLSPPRHVAAIRGGIGGLVGTPPPLPPGVARDGRAIRRLIDLKRRIRSGAGRGRARFSSE